ncbi:MAG: MerR family transcriptional regulator [Oscillospiraceae bacterium]|nr:MerR family transcriptional regulator [Oscillospiraceae bacterium]
MDKDRAIPDGYMTVGGLAKKMKTTVRTLQYYDREGLLSPSAQSEGGRRLYTDRDTVRLYCIQSMKYLGFSLDDIRSRLPALETPGDVSAALAGQAEGIRAQIAALSKALDATEKLRAATLKMASVNWERYADIVALLRMGNEHYELITQFDDKLMSHIRGFDPDGGKRLMDTFKRLLREGAELPRHGIAPESARGQHFAKEWWDYVTEFTGGNMGLLPELVEMSGKMDGFGGSMGEEWKTAQPFVEKSLEVYFANLGYDPFAEVKP